MTFTAIKQLLRMLAVLLVVFGSGGTGAAAMCSAELVHCYSDAAALDDWLARAAAGLDCDFTYALCVRDSQLAF
jgi:hypothetical protein